MKKLKVISLFIITIIGIFLAIPSDNNPKEVLSDVEPISVKEEAIIEEKTDIIEPTHKEVVEVQEEKPTTEVKTPTPKVIDESKETKPKEPIYLTDVSASYEKQINEYRISNGLKALPVTDEAKNEANKRAMELVTDYSHNSSFGFGENIGNATANIYNFVELWKDSPTHNATMLRDQRISFAVSVVEYNDGMLLLHLRWIIQCLNSFIGDSLPCLC